RGNGSCLDSYCKAPSGMDAPRKNLRERRPKSASAKGNRSTFSSAAASFSVIQSGGLPGIIFDLESNSQKEGQLRRRGGDELQQLLSKLLRPLPMQRVTGVGKDLE